MTERVYGDLADRRHVPPDRKWRRAQRNFACAGLLVLLTSAAEARTLEQDLGRRESRLYSSTYEVPVGRTIAETALVDRLERLGYQRVSRRPERPGEFFWGFEVFRLYRREVAIGARVEPAREVALAIDRGSGRILGARRADGAVDRRRSIWIDPELLGESLDEARARRRPVRLELLPERVWRTVLAAEDHRFFEHGALDPRGVARAAVKNVLSRKVVQGGSTITQQLVKLRELTPKRTFGRKASEALRAYDLERRYSKAVILESYLNSVYFGHLSGVAVYGLGTASVAYFDRPAERLTLGQAALLAAMIQGPNRLSPVRNPERAEARRRWVLGRMRELGWADRRQVATALAAPPTIRHRRLAAVVDRRLLAGIREEVKAEVPGRLDRQLGVVVRTAIDPYLQQLAEAAVSAGLEELAGGSRRGRLAAALVAVDARSGGIVAYVSGPPGRRGDEYDRARLARRQPGSTLKPLVLLEAFAACGSRRPLYPSRRVSDRSLSLELPSGTWRPRNPDGRFRAEVELRQALVDSLNLPFVRVGRWCGLEPTARRLRAVGLGVPSPPPPSFLLGAIEQSPLEMVGAYTPLASGGWYSRPGLVRRVETPGGRRLAWRDGDRRLVADPASAYLVRELLRDAVAAGSANAAAIPGLDVYGKTGTSSGERDAWFVGGAGDLLAVVWVGLDDGAPLGRSGAAAALPIWRRFMKRAALTLPAGSRPRPRGVVERWIDDESGRIFRQERAGARRELFRKGTVPARWGRPGRVEPPIE